MVHHKKIKKNGKKRGMSAEWMAHIRSLRKKNGKGKKRNNKQLRKSRFLNN